MPLADETAVFERRASLRARRATNETKPTASTRSNCEVRRGGSGSPCLKRGGSASPRSAKRAAVSGVASAASAGGGLRLRGASAVGLWRAGGTVRTAAGRQSTVGCARVPRCQLTPSWRSLASTVHSPLDAAVVLAPSCKVVVELYACPFARFPVDGTDEPERARHRFPSDFERDRLADVQHGRHGAWSVDR